LIVDDEPAIAELIQAVLQTAGIHADVETNSRKADEQLAKEKFDVIFLDVHMPQPDGIELARRARSGGFNQSTPLVMITGLDDLTVQKKAFEAGANFFLFKPVDRQRVLRVVRSTQAAVQHERRRFQRVAVACKVSLAAGEKTLEGKTLDVSLGGLQAETKGVFPSGTTVAVFLHLGSGAPLRVRGTVVRAIGEMQMGVQFSKLDAVDSERLQEFLLPHILKQLDEEPRKEKQSR
jgi:CheY-like chemotaxis protein